MNPLVAIADRFLRHVQVGDDWVEDARAAAMRGPIVFVVRTSSLVDYLALTHLVRRFGLPPIGYASEIPRLLRIHDSVGDDGLPALERALDAKRSALLFLKRSPGLVTLPRGVPGESDERLGALLSVQERIDGEVMLLPVAFIWSAHAERRGFSVLDGLFGPTDMPGDVRAVAQFFLHHRSCVVRAGDAVSLREFMLADPDPGPARVRRLTYALLRKVERERRAIVGPARKAPDRVRDEVLRSPKLKHIVSDMVKHGGADPEAIARRADKMLRELSALPSPELVEAIAPIADALVQQVYTGIDVDTEGLERLRAASKRGGVVLLPSHKSHVDYLILSYVLKKHMLELPLIASGDNLAFFPVGAMLRRGGAFFIRRSFRGDKLYAALVDAYIRRVIKDGWAIEFFLEGGRSRTGKLLPPQLGLLNIVVDAALELESRPLSFVPISIVYERTMEDVELVRERAGAPKEKESARSLLAVGEALLEKYGRVNVQFGQVIDLAAFRRDVGLDGATLTPAKRRALVTRLANRVMSEINNATAVTAGALVATALLDMEGRGLAHHELVARCGALLETALRAGARPAKTLHVRAVGANGEERVVLREASIREATFLFARSGLIKQHVPDDVLGRAPARRRRPYGGEDVVYTVPEEARSRLDLSKNAIQHFFVERAIVSAAALSSRREPLDRDEITARAVALGKLLSHEFAYRSGGTPEEFVAATWRDMEANGELEDELLCRQHARHIDNFLEGYRVAARTLRVLVHGALAAKEFFTRAFAVGQQMFLGGEIDRREAISRPLIETALLAFADAGWVKRSLDTLALTESHAGEREVRAIEATIASYVVRRGSS
ncbi:MAG: 1-acyl-sn-glycerol-3-phosphate acyltransferase [Polyangiaceae bacterium]